MENTLYYGDNLDILKRYIPDECIDLARGRVIWILNRLIEKPKI